MLKKDLLYTLHNGRIRLGSKADYDITIVDPHFLHSPILFIH